MQARTTRFDVALDPEGLGKVNVSIAIGAKGDMSAHLTFERPEAASAIANESGALRQALQDAGFNLKSEDLTFQSGASFSGSQFANGQDQQQQSGAGRSAFSAMARMVDNHEIAALGSATASAARGLDIRI